MARGRLRAVGPWRLLAWPVLLAFTVSCTRDVARAPLETRRFAVNWDGLDARRVETEGGLSIDGVVLTPTQWPLEASVKKLLQGEFVGVIENLDLSFRPATLREDVLQRLFDEGFLPVYLRIRNSGSKPAAFDPAMVVVRADQTVVLQPYPAERLPRRFREIDWAGTGLGVVVGALMIVLVVAGSRNRGPNRLRMARTADVSLHVGVRGGLAGGRRDSGGRRRSAAAGRRSERGLLRAEMVEPGEMREGFVFYRLDETVADWSTARIAGP